jgi:hypothetical protein
MKSLLFTLLLLPLILISSSLTAPTQTNSRIHQSRQRVIYTIFTLTGAAFTIEILYDPRPGESGLVAGGFRYTSFEHRPEETFMRVEISRRNVERFTFNENSPEVQRVFISANIEFTPQYVDGRGALPAGTLQPGVFVVDPGTVALRHITFMSPNPVPHSIYPQTVRFVFMTVLEPSASGLDPQTEHIIETQGIEGFLQQGGAPLTSQRPQPPVQLDPRIWIHLLSNRMSEYQHGAIECTGAPKNLKRRPHDGDTCGASSTRPHPRGPDDPGDPGAQRGAKRPFLQDLNEVPIGLNDDIAEDQCGAGGADQSHNRQQVDLSNSDQRGLEPAAKKETSPQKEVIFDLPPMHVEIQEGISLTDLYGYWDVQVIPGGLTREDNTSSLKRPLQIRCFEVSGH